MKCRCGAELAQVNAKGEPMVRTRGMVFKAAGVCMVCPKCKGDVPLGPDEKKMMVLFLKRPES